MNRSFVKKFNVTTVLSVVLSCVFLCAVSLVFVSCASRLSAADSAALAKLESVDAASPEGADILIFADTIINKHVGATELLSVSDFCEKAIDAANRLDESASPAGSGQRLVSLYFELCKLAAMLHDGHTGVQMPQEMLPFLETYPFSVNVIGGKLIVSTIGLEYQNLIGLEIAEINGHSVEEVISSLKTIISFDTEAFAMANIAQLLNIREVLDFTGLGSENGILRLLLSDGSEISLEALTVEQLESEQELTTMGVCSLVTNVERTLYRNSLYECYDLDAETLFVQYNACMNAEGYSVADFTKDVLGFIDNMGFTRVIIDLRNNGGGNSMLFDPFINQLGKRISAGQCKGFVLIGTNTFSSAVLNAWDLKKAGCTLVGTPTGGAINHYGELGYITLPHSGINATYSTKHFILDPKAAPGSIQPDVLVELSVDDLRSGYDAQTAACLEM